MPAHSDYFHLATSWLLSPDIEGEHSNDPADRGGDTWYGLSRSANPDMDWPPTKEHAVEAYHRKYWTACRCDELPPRLAIALFDSAVQHGQITAIKLLQRTLRVKADGLIGPITISNANQQTSTDLPLSDFLSHRGRYYSEIVVNDHSQRRFIRGWMRRLFLLQNMLLRIQGD